MASNAPKPLSPDWHHIHTDADVGFTLYSKNGKLPQDSADVVVIARGAVKPSRRYYGSFRFGKVRMGSDFTDLSRIAPEVMDALKAMVRPYHET